MNDKPRIGRPRNQDGHTYQTIGISGTPAEIAAVLDILTPRQRMKVLLAALDALDYHDDKPAQGKE
jgi:hypothetical protein